MMITVIMATFMAVSAIIVTVILGLDTPICQMRMVHITGHLAVRQHSPIWHHHTTRIVFIWTLTMEYGIVRMMKRNPLLVAVSIR